MNRLTIKQRKLLYFGLIVGLLIPIILLGMPATEQEDSGGMLAQMREEHQLGETTLGQVDPSSATMNLILLGMRGIATDLLWLQANKQQETKDWAQLRTTVDSIILLQPHYIKVWKFQGWNLSYNVSAEWDQVEDRYYWVKEGTKFLARGSKRNEQNPELYWETGKNLSQKIGRSDEWRLFRDYFNEVDPDKNVWVNNVPGPDPDLNPEGKDNYLVAKDWFVDANYWEAAKYQRQHIMMRILFRSYPARSQLDYAEALQREGLFTDLSRKAWDDALKEWTQEYGQEIYISPAGRIRLETEPEEIPELIRLDQDPQDGEPKFNFSADEKMKWVANYQNVTNYRYWRTRAYSEKEDNTMRAHAHIHAGQALYRDGKTARTQNRITKEGEQALAAMESDSREKRVLQALSEASTSSGERGTLSIPELVLETMQVKITEAGQRSLRPTPETTGDWLVQVTKDPASYQILQLLQTSAPESFIRIREIASATGLSQELIRRELYQLRSLAEGTASKVELEEISEQDMGNLTLDLEAQKKLERRSIAQLELEKGMAHYEQMLKDFPTLGSEDLTIEEGLLALMYWRENFGKAQDLIPEEHPLKDLWEAHQNRLPELRKTFQREVQGVQ